MKLFLSLSCIIPFFCISQTVVKKTFYPNGSLLSEISYKDGKRDGICKTFWQNDILFLSVIKTEGNYKNGRMIGQFKSYFQNGQIESQGTFKYTDSEVYSRKDGVWKYYYNNGKIQSESIIKDGVEKLKFYDKQGNLTPIGNGC
jgi:antitoxin component YwqK of YwqJK toxin-antitoxin module